MSDSAQALAAQRRVNSGPTAGSPLARPSEADANRLASVGAGPADQQTPSRDLTELAVLPQDLHDLRNRSRSGVSWCELARRAHGGRASAWGVTGTWIRVVTALAAALSALSVVTAIDGATIGLTLTTAILSTLNATLDPAGRAERHRKAHKEYARLVRHFADLDSAVLAQASVREQEQSVFEYLRGVLLRLETEAEKVDESAPPVGGTKISTALASGAAEDTWTWWKVHQLKKQSKWRARADAVRGI